MTTTCDTCRNRDSEGSDSNSSKKPLELQTFYDILQVPASASTETIKASFHRLARRYHPDKKLSQQETLGNPGESQNPAHDNHEDEIFYQQIQEAWECLRDSTKRKEYDAILWQQRKRKEFQKAKAILISPEECRIEEVEEEVFLAGTDDCIIRIVNVFIYTCRCGQEIEIDVDDSAAVGVEFRLPQQSGEEQTKDGINMNTTTKTEELGDLRKQQQEQKHLVECTGCSLVYDTSACYLVATHGHK